MTRVSRLVATSWPSESVYRATDSTKSCVPPREDDFSVIRSRVQVTEIQSLAWTGRSKLYSLPARISRLFGTGRCHSCPK